MNDGTVASAEKRVADAHPNGKSPWGWDDYVAKFDRLAGERIDAEERNRFVDRAARLSTLASGEIRAINPSMPIGTVVPDVATGQGIFDFEGSS